MVIGRSTRRSHMSLLRRRRGWFPAQSLRRISFAHRRRDRHAFPECSHDDLVGASCVMKEEAVAATRRYEEVALRITAVDVDGVLGGVRLGALDLGPGDAQTLVAAFEDGVAVVVEEEAGAGMRDPDDEHGGRG